jgi:hypothetical protein
MAAVVLGAAAAAEASPIYTCPSGSSECMGQTFAQWISGSGAGYFDIATSINTIGYTGPAGSLAFGIETKDLITPNSVYSAVSLLSAPGGTGTWAVNTTQLSQDCATPGFQDTACAYWNSTGAGYAFTVGDTLTWVIRITTSGSLETMALGTSNTST